MFVTVLLLASTHIADVQGAEGFARGEMLGTAVRADGTVITTDTLVDDGTVDGWVLQAWPDGRSLLAEPLRLVAPDGTVLASLPNRLAGGACQASDGMYFGGLPDGIILFRPKRKNHWRPVVLPHAHEAVWQIACAGNEAWAVTSAPSYAYRLRGGVVNEAIKVPGVGLRSVLIDGDRQWFGGLRDHRVWRRAEGSLRVAAATRFAEVLSLHKSNAGVVALSIDSAQGKPGRFPAPNGDGGGALERLDEQGIHALWTTSGELPLSAAVESDGEAYVGTDRGLIYRIDGRRILRIAVPDRRPVEAIVRSGQKVTVWGGGMRRVLRARTTHKIVSERLDAKHRARWGNLRTEGDGVKAVRWRFGEDPKGIGWGEWQSQPGGSGRFAQFEITLKPGGRLVRVQQFFAPNNRVPKLLSIGLLAPGTRLDDKTDNPVERKQSFTLPEIKLEKFVKGTNHTPQASPVERRGQVVRVRGHRGVVWHAKDPDGDPLTYRARLARITRDGAEPVREEVRDRPYWNVPTSGLPQGVYRVEVAATDGESTWSEALRSAVFDVDHQAPTLRVLRFDTRRGVLELEAKDNDRVVSVTCRGSNFELLLRPATGLSDGATTTFAARGPLRSRVGELSRCSAVDPQGNSGSVTLDR
jgi:hypothetical protein